MALPKEFKICLIKAANNQHIFQIVVPETILLKYQDLDIGTMKVQLQMLPDLVKAYRNSQHLT